MRSFPPSPFQWKGVTEVPPLRGFRVPPCYPLGQQGGEAMITDPKGKRAP
jgi:hypothetical protein